MEDWSSVYFKVSGKVVSVLAVTPYAKCLGDVKALSRSACCGWTCEPWLEDSVHHQGTGSMQERKAMPGLSNSFPHRGGTRQMVAPIDAGFLHSKQFGIGVTPVDPLIGM